MAIERSDVTIIGTGPAGLQAAIHAGRKKATVAVLGKMGKSSAFKAQVENYCCISHITGAQMLQEGRHQAEKAGVHFLEQDVLSLEQAEPGFRIETEAGTTIHSASVILAMGISRKKLRVPGEKELLGRGVSYCVECDANFFHNVPVAVVGNESAAVAGALTLLFYAGEVHLICDQLQVADTLAVQVRDGAIHLHEGRKVKEISGETAVRSVLLDDGTELAVAGVFIELGAKGAVELATGIDVNLDPESFQYIVTDKKQATNVAGIYGAGDICGPPWQIAKAVGEGCVAGLEAAAYAKKLEGWSGGH